MSMFKYSLKLIFFFLGNQIIIPFVFSIVVAKFRRKKWMENAYMYVGEGFLLQLALFFVLAKVGIYYQISLSALCKEWICVEGGLGLIVFWYARKEMFSVSKDIKQAINKKSLLYVLGFGITLGVILILFRFILLSDALDNTIEVANVNVTTNTISEYNPYTGESVDPELVRNQMPHIALWYSVFSYMLQRSPNILIRFVFSFHILLIVTIVFIQLSKSIWREDTRKKYLWLIIVIYMAMVFSISNSHTGFDIFGTTWNESVIYNYIILPLILCEVLNAKLPIIKK